MIDKDTCQCGHSRYQHTKGNFLPGCSADRCYCCWFRSRFDSSGNLKTEYTDKPVCPKCGEYDHDWFDYELRGDEDITTIWCSNCDAEYSIQLHIEYKFSTAMTEKELERI